MDTNDLEYSRVWYWHGYGNHAGAENTKNEILAHGIKGTKTGMYHPKGIFFGAYATNDLNYYDTHRHPDGTLFHKIQTDDSWNLLLIEVIIPLNAVQRTVRGCKTVKNNGTCIMFPADTEEPGVINRKVMLFDPSMSIIRYVCDVVID